MHCSIWTDKQSYAPGDTARFQWLSVNARSASIDGVGPVALSGYWRTPVQRSGSVTLRVRGESGERICAVNYTVRAQRPTCHISAIPLAVAQNSFVTLSWNTQFASSVSVSGIGTVPASGSRVVRAEKNQTYTLTAVGDGGSCTMGARVQVQSPTSAYGYFPSVVNSVAAPLFGYSQPRTYDVHYFDTYYEPVYESVWYEERYYEPDYWYEERYYSPEIWPEHDDEDWDPVADQVWRDADLRIDPNMDIPPPLDLDLRIETDICLDDWCREWGAGNGVGRTILDIDPNLDLEPKYVPEEDNGVIFNVPITEEELPLKEDLAI